MRRVGRILLALAVAATVAIGSLARDVPDAHASDPSGVYALIDGITLEPGDGPPTRVRIDGMFCVAHRKRGSAYRTPQIGSLVYSLSPGTGERQEREQKLIADLRKHAGKGTVVAFGSRWKMLETRITAPGEQIEKPPMLHEGVGVSAIRSAQYGPIGQLLAMPRIVGPTGDLPMRVHERYGAMDSVTFEVENPASKLEGVRLLFEVERANGDITASGPVALGADGRTTHAMWHDFTEGETVTLRVRAVHDELAHVAVARSTFTVRKAP